MDYFVAIDFGAESGRVMLGSLDQGRLVLEEIHRFLNKPLQGVDSLRWNLDQLYAEVLEGLKKVASRGIQPRSISCDSWGCDYILLDEAGQPLEPAYVYRDKRTDGIYDSAFSRVSREKIYEETGIQFMPFNTLYQLFAADRDGTGNLRRAKRFLMVADYIHYRLGGKPGVDHSNASTTQALNPRTMRWSDPLISGMDLPESVFPELIETGSKLGVLSEAVQRQTGLGACEIVATCSHDTGAAVAGTPGEGDDWAYLSCGTWSLLGVELSQPMISDATLKANFTNEVGFQRTIRFLKNITGLWVVQECKRDWEANGRVWDYGQLTRMAAQAKPFQAVMNPDAARFAAPGGMPDRMKAWFMESGQSVPETEGDYVRIALESLAFKYRMVLDTIESLTGRKIARLHMVGGGIKNELLCQFAANAIGRPVVAGPVEATAYGNCLMQAVSAGVVPSFAAMRQVIRVSEPMRTYLPDQADVWSECFEKSQHLLSAS